MNSRELVNKCISFSNPERAPRQLWLLPTMEKQYPKELKRIQNRYPDDIIWCHEYLTEKLEITGNPYIKGEYIDPWGCKFQNLQDGIIGEVKEPLILGEDWEDSDKLIFPESIQSIDVEQINKFCRESDKFILSGFNPRPFERLQWIRGTEQLYIDIALQNEGFASTLNKIHEFYCRLVENWCQTEIDALFIQDDWGAQNSLLINPETWVELFKPLYQDYTNIAKKYNKKIFMHSDGNISSIIPHL